MKIILPVFLSLISLSSFAVSEPNLGEFAARHFEFQFRSAKNQKDLLQRLSSDPDFQKQATAFLRKTRFEGVPVPNTSVTGATLELKGRHPVQIDFSQLQDGRVVIQNHKIDLNQNPSVEEIYRQVTKPRSASSLWLSKAIAADPDANESLGSLVGLAGQLFFMKSDAPAPKTIPKKYRGLIKGYEKDETLKDFTCDPKTKSISKIETSNGHETTVLEIQIHETEMKATRAQAGQKCSVTTQFHGSSGYGHFATEWICGGKPSTQDYFPAYYAEEMNRCCQTSCADELRNQLPKSQAKASSSSSQSTSAPTTK